MSEISDEKRVYTQISGASLFEAYDRITTSYEALAAKFKVEKYTVDSPPGSIEDRVFIGGSYVLMPILREIETIVKRLGFTPIIAKDYDMPSCQMSDYTLRLLSQCKHVIFDLTISGGHQIEQVRVAGFRMNVLQLYMASDERKRIPKTANAMDFERPPPPEGYLTIQDLRDLVEAFLSRIAVDK